MPIAINPQTGETVFLGKDGAWQKAPTAVNPQTKETLAFDGEGWKPLPQQQPQSKGLMGYVDDAARSLASGVTFGYADEIAAKMNELTGLGGSYDQNVAKERARDEAIPGAVAIPGQIAGAVGSTVAAAPLAGAAMMTRLGQLAARLPQAFRFGMLGALEGGVAGSGAATEGNRLEGAASGAAIGAPVGAAAPMVIRGASNLVNRVRGAVSPQANVAADLGRAIVRDADTPADLMARANNLSIDRPGVATLADAGGENVKGLVERVAQTPGAGRTQVVPALTGRQQAQVQRISTDLRALTGTNRTAVQAIEETMANRARSASPIYREIFTEFDVPIRSPEIDRLMSSDLVVSAMRRAVSSGKDRAVREGYGAFNPSVRVTDDGQIIFQRGANGQPVYPNLQFWDQVKRELDKVGSIAARTGDTETPANARGLARLLRTELDTVTTNPRTNQSRYREARDIWAGESAYLDAIEQGRSILARNVSSEEYISRFRGLSRAEQEADRIGAVSAIVARMGNDPARLGDMTKYLRSPEMRAKVSAIMPTPEATAAWQRRLEFEIGSSELTNRALGNSATARRLAERADAEDLVGDLVMDGLTGAPQSIVRRVLGAGPRWLRDTMRSRADALLADTLTNPQANANLPNILQRAVTSGRPPSAVTNASGTAAGVTLANQ